MLALSQQRRIIATGTILGTFFGMLQTLENIDIDVEAANQQLKQRMVGCVGVQVYQDMLSHYELEDVTLDEESVLAGLILKEETAYPHRIGEVNPHEQLRADILFSTVRRDPEPRHVALYGLLGNIRCRTAKLRQEAAQVSNPDLRLQAADAE
jgi:hypothetical protein